MAGYTRRAYKGSAVATTLTASMSNVATSCTIAAYTGWPYGSDPFYVVISPGTAAEEKVLVTRTGATDTTLNVVTSGRGVDDTSAQSHDSGAGIYPVFTAKDADEANVVASTQTTKGDLLTHTGTAHARLAVGSDGQALVADSGETSGLAWASVISESVVDAKGDLLAGTADNTIGRLAVGTNEHRLVADSGETTGLKFVADTTNYAVGAKGDLLVGTAADTVSNLAVGSNGFVPVADSGETTGIKWFDPYLLPENNQTASYTLVLGDAAKLVSMDVATANDLTVPANTSVAFPVGTQILVYQEGAGQTTIVADSGVTIRSSGAKLKLTDQYSVAGLLKLATDEWVAFGNLTA